MIEFILYFFSTSLLQLTIVYFYNQITSRKLSIHKKDIIGLGIYPLIHSIVRIIGCNIIIPFLTIINFIVLFKNLYNDSWKKSVIYSLVIWMLCIVLDMVTMLLVNLLEPIRTCSVAIQQILSTFVMIIILIILSKIKLLFEVISKIYKRASRIKLNILYLSEIIIFFVLIEFICLKNLENTNLIMVTVFLGIFSITFFGQQLSLLHGIYTLQKTNTFLEKNNQVNRRIITEYRIIKHNLENSLLGVKTIANKEAKALLDEIIKEYNSSFYTKSEINDMPNGINGLLLEKIYDYKENNINILINNRITNEILGSIGARNYNLLCESLGVTMDNALRACNESKERLLLLDFKETSGELVVSITNSFKGSLDIEKLGRLNYSTKSKKSGLGLFSIYNKKNLIITNKIKNNIFTSVIKIKKMSQC